MDAGVFYTDFVQKYIFFDSIISPLLVISDESPPINYRVIEVYEDSLKLPDDIAKMSFIKLEHESKVIIEVIWEDDYRCILVKSLARALLRDLRNKGYKISSIIPSDLLDLPKVVYANKEQIGDYVERAPVTEETQSTPGLPEEVNHSDEEELASFIGSPNTPSKSNVSFTLNNVDPESVVKRYGTYRELTLSEVKTIVAKCKDFQSLGGTIMAFYYEKLSEFMSSKFSFETLRSWVKDKKFKP